MQNSIQRISSNWTLGLKVFFPTFWFVFYGAIVLALFVTPSAQLQIFGEMNFKMAVLIFYVSGSIVIYFTLMRLKRVEFDHDFLYVSNFFITLRIPWHNVKKHHERKILWLHLGSFSFHEPTRFGKQITFIESRSLMKEFRVHAEALLNN
ncbi:MAG: hypothetical protein GVX78_03525 [Bacteroidetes bacterium]|jgi:hypothetical protein|nr:hypothetical protein [Bacteroidota bacterium]